MGEDLKVLLEIQDIDEDILKLAKEKAEIPVMKDILRLKEGEKSAQIYVDKIEGQLQQYHRQSRKLELDLAENRGLLDEISQKLYSGGVNNAKELSQMEVKAGELKAKISALEDGILNIMVQTEELDGSKNHGGQQHLTLQEELQSKIGEYTKINARLVREIKELNKLRDELAQSIPSTLLGTYERMKERKRGKVVAAVSEGMCQGCKVSLFAPSLQSLRKGDKVVFCENCGRILCLVD